MSDGAKTGTPLWVPMREKLDGLLRDETSNTYVCGRVWHAWNVGTMSEDDFTKFDSGDRIEQLVYEVEAICEERIQQEKSTLADALTEALKVAGEAETALRELLLSMNHIDLTEGVCMCGGTDPRACGNHSFTDAGSHIHGGRVIEAKKALAEFDSLRKGEG